MRELHVVGGFSLHRSKFKEIEEWAKEKRC
jgi:hypothetical protein